MDNQEMSGLLLLFSIFGIAWCIHYLLKKTNKTEKEQASGYTDEEIALAEFLEKKQAINDLYLQVHKELLQHLRR
ncbi:hypothetical protein [Streptococcus moroccensis]|uniref:Phage protein n=1 Tax=Streptococcus moroccensis TaxID=1451356 RepID=A0ABT9YQ09_9STRE|nr:hypothetical protein [Streptococcus moroccensis]MDQ0222068.1 hypothetical protein [Streptococcus moroccensis]